ncbi:MAG: Pr6Pr family membrane protein [Candidatus Hodarchaeales archaeon]|jgi:hypothetical protein
MVSEKQKNLIWVTRLSFALLGWFTLFMSHYLQMVDFGSLSFSLGIKILSSYRYFTMQTNFFVLIWLSFALFYYNNPNVMAKLHSPVKGALTIYISVTFFVFTTILSPLYQPTGFDAFSNIVLHYIIPLIFIFDWITTEKVSYQWKYLIIWLIYPITYLFFSQIHGVLTGSYLYPFLNSRDLGFLNFIVNVILLLILFVSLSLLCFLTSKMLKIRNKTF